MLTLDETNVIAAKKKLIQFKIMLEYTKVY